MRRRREPVSIEVSTGSVNRSGTTDYGDAVTVSTWAEMVDDANEVMQGTRQLVDTSAQRIRLRYLDSHELKPGMCRVTIREAVHEVERVTVDPRRRWQVLELR